MARPDDAFQVSIERRVALHKLCNTRYEKETKRKNTIRETESNENEVKRKEGS